MVPRNGQSLDVLVQFGEERVHLVGDDIVTFTVGSGEHSLNVLHGNESHEFNFFGTSSPPSTPPEICSIAPRSEDLSIQALLRGEIDFTVDSFVPIDWIELTIEIEAGGRRFFSTAQIGPLPCVVSSSQEPFITMLDEEVRGLLLMIQSLNLRLNLGRFCSRSLVLEQRVRPCWWQQGTEDKFNLTSEIGNLPFGVVSATSPLSHPVKGLDGLHEETQLLAPINLDESEFGVSAQFSTICIAPSRLNLQPPTLIKPRLMRRRRSKVNAYGIEDLVESLLRWSLAESATLIAEIRRRQICDELGKWFTEICCGEEWVRNEILIGEVDPWEALARVCDETGLGRDPHIELSRKDEIEVTRIAVREIRQEMPDLWLRVCPPCDLGPEDYKALDLACGRAYTNLANIYKKLGKDDIAVELSDGDPGSAPDEWNVALERVKATYELQSLASMLFPSDRANVLMKLDPALMTLDELVEEFTEWIQSAKSALSGSVPSSDTLKAILALWIEPEIALSHDWRGALDVLLAERVVARSARYLALRSRCATLRRNS
ncbi:hypothetical protein DSECCO2_484830 [anaerobic digester metagenome]